MSAIGKVFSAKVVQRFATLRGGGGRSAGSTVDVSMDASIVSTVDGLRQVVYFYSATPTIDLPVACSGIDEDGATVAFFGRSTGAGFELRDPLRDVITYDLQLGDLAILTSWPADPAANATTDWAGTNKAAVSAHVNASKVCSSYGVAVPRRHRRQRDGPGQRRQLQQQP